MRAMTAAILVVAVLDGCSGLVDRTFAELDSGASGQSVTASSTMSASGAADAGSMDAESADIGWTDTEGGASGSSVGSVVSTSASSAASCGAGCLCFSTPETCPSGCSPMQRGDGTFICGNACDGPGVPCNCVYRPDDGGIYVCDSFTVPACPAVTSGPCDSSQGPCMSCGKLEAPTECGCSDEGPFAGDAGPTWMCLGTEEACQGP
jgi:hypothetical protein